MKQFHEIEEQFKQDLENEINKILSTSKEKKDELITSALELRTKVNWGSQPYQITFLLLYSL